MRAASRRLSCFATCRDAVAPAFSDFAPAAAVGLTEGGDHVRSVASMQQHPFPALLYYEEVSIPGTLDGPGGPTRTACFVHGLLGSGRNWRSFSRKLAEAAAQQSGRGWRMLLLDQRNHGESSRLQGFHAPHSIESSAADLRAVFAGLLGEGGVPDAVVGHSMGGKVVLALLRQLQQERQQQHGSSSGNGSAVGLPKQAWVLDSDPGVMRAGADRDVDRVLSEVQALRMPLQSRAALADVMHAKGFSLGLTQWLGSNLVPVDKADPSKGLVWAFQLQGAAAMYNSYRITDFWKVLQHPPEGCQVHTVVGELSDRFTPDAMERLHEAERESRRKIANGNGGGGSGGGESTSGEQQDMHVHVLPAAGHWVHVDNPDGLLAMMLPHFAK